MHGGRHPSGSIVAVNVAVVLPAAAVGLDTVGGAVGSDGAVTLMLALAAATVTLSSR
jgi:hypothetical protein